MRVETVKQYVSKLPENDPHPYRTGAWTPNTREVDAYDLDVVAGEIPRDLSGTYLRNTENPLFDAVSGVYHPFDGDGMLHSIHFENGAASYRNRFVKTAGLAAELSAGEPLWAGILESPELSKREGWGSRTRMKDASSTDVTVHAGLALTTFYQCGDAYLMDPVTLEPRGVAKLARTSELLPGHHDLSTPQSRRSNRRPALLQLLHRGALLSRGYCGQARSTRSHEARRAPRAATAA